MWKSRQKNMLCNAVKLTTLYPKPDSKVCLQCKSIHHFIPIDQREQVTAIQFRGSNPDSRWIQIRGSNPGRYQIGGSRSQQSRSSIKGSRSQQFRACSLFTFSWCLAPLSYSLLLPSQWQTTTMAGGSSQFISWQNERLDNVLQGAANRVLEAM